MRQRRSSGASYRQPFRSSPILPVGDRGFVVTVISEAGQFHHERRTVTWDSAVRVAEDFADEFPSRLILISDHIHIWRLSELEQR